MSVQTMGATQGPMAETHKQTLIMTRPRAAGMRFVAGLSQGALHDTKVIHAPLIEVVGVGAPVDLDGVASVIFTSANGVQHAPEGQGRRAYCVGARTAAQARTRGWIAQTTAPNAQALIAQMQSGDVSGPLLHLCGQHTRGDIAQHLSASGLQVSEQVVYHQPLQPLSAPAAQAIAGEVRVILPLFSPRTAAHLADQLGGVTNTFVFAMSGAVARALGDDSRFADVQISPEPTGDAMTRGVENWLSQDSLS